MTTGLLIWTAILCVLVATLAAIANRVLREFAGHELEAYCRSRERLDLLDEILRSRERIAHGAEAMQMTAIACTVTCASLWFSQSYQFAVDSDGTVSLGRLGCFVLVLSALLIVTNSWLPSVFASLSSAPFLFHTWRIWHMVSRVAWPVLLGFNVTASFVRRLLGKVASRDQEEEALEEEIRSIVTAGERTGLLEEDAADMIERVIELDDTTVSQIMTPVSKVDSMDVNATWDEMIRLITDVRRSRIPVYEQSVDNVIGILVIKDLLPVLARGNADTPGSFRRFLREPQFVPGTNNVDDVLQHFLKARDHLAVVLDEYHNVCGIVTIEDVLEEIVGEIRDESDEVGAMEVERIDRNTADVLGSTHVTDINDALGCDLPVSVEYDTISGLVFNRLHDIPKVGETLTIDGVSIEITQASRRAISRLRLRLPEAS